ncbi:DUF1801 domain-containing protein [Tundrisphaera lichenicola]|uniref:DUF1801 domain-containing protein n=1 Tax=Tundrisphaera lichenicola TaxID=2029860 RepID=UPI003EBE836F
MDEIGETIANPEVDEYIRTHEKWREELQKLRSIVLGCPLVEEVKWRAPCYTHEGGNIAILGAFKDYCALTFMKGVLLKDPDGILDKPGENTRTARLIRFTSVREIVAVEPALIAYLLEAIAVEKAGLKSNTRENAEYSLPEELRKKLDESPALKAAFAALTPGRQRAYALFFSAAKQSKTRESRVEQYTRQILEGKGLNDCTCGLTRRPPACDGSHKDDPSRRTKDTTGERRPVTGSEGSDGVPA